MTPPAERKAKERKARKEAGLVRVEMWVHKNRAAEVRALAAGWQTGTAKSAKITAQTVKSAIVAALDVAGYGLDDLGDADRAAIRAATGGIL